MGTLKRINPFKPNLPVNPEGFVGRKAEIGILESALHQTRAGRPRPFWISGERGIGKTSLLNYASFLAQKGNDAKNDFNFLVINADIGQRTTRFGLIRRVERGLERELAKTEKERHYLHKTWGFLHQIKALGIELQGEQAMENEELLLDEFVYSLSRTAQRLCEEDDTKRIFSSHYDGVLILVDEVDNAPDQLGLGEFFQLFLLGIQRQPGGNKVMVGLAGLPEMEDVLRKSHLSSLRLFKDISLDRLDSDEVSSIIDIYLDIANDLNETQTTITSEARESLIGLTEGYPYFIQQFGYSVFEADTDNQIDIEDVTAGAFGPHGAMQAIGDKFYRNDFYNEIGKESRQVLRIMAYELDVWVTKNEIRDQFKGGDSTLDDAIKALLARRSILPKEGQRDVYRLQQKGFALWIKLYTDTGSLE